VCLFDFLRNSLQAGAGSCFTTLLQLDRDVCGEEARSIGCILAKHVEDVKRVAQQHYNEHVFSLWPLAGSFITYIRMNIYVYAMSNAFTPLMTPRCLILGLFCLILGLFCLILGLFCLILGLFCLILGLFCLILGLFCLILGLFLCL